MVHFDPPLQMGRVIFLPPRRYSPQINADEHRLFDRTPS